MSGGGKELEGERSAPVPPPPPPPKLDRGVEVCDSGNSATPSVDGRGRKLLLLLLFLNASVEEFAGTGTLAPPASATRAREARSPSASAALTASASAGESVVVDVEVEEVEEDDGIKLAEELDDAPSHRGDCCCCSLCCSEDLEVSIVSSGTGRCRWMERRSAREKRSRSKEAGQSNGSMTPSAIEKVSESFFFLFPFFFFFDIFSLFPFPPALFLFFRKRALCQSRRTRKLQFE